LELLKETVPSASQIAILSQQGITHTLWPGLHYAAGVLGVELMPLEVQHLGDLVRAFEAAVRQRADALLVLPEPLFAARRAPQLPELAAAYRLPSMYWQRDAVEAGGLMSYGTNLPALWRRAAYYVDRILKGAKPADLPVEQPMTFEFVVNLKTARDLGITFPREILLQVTEVIDQ
jgi:putative ABC transport system substrate-binding protein